MSENVTKEEREEHKGSLYDKPGSPYLWMRFSYKGKRYQESTGKKHRDAAERVMIDRIKSVKGGYMGLFAQILADIDKVTIDKQGKVDAAERVKIKKKLATELLSGSGYEVTKKPVVRLKLSGAFPVYRAQPEFRSTSASTLNSYKSMWDLFLEWMGKKHPKVVYMDEVTKVMAKQYFSYVNMRDVTTRTYNGYLKLLKSVFDKLEEESGVKVNPFAKLDNLPLQTESRAMLTAEELGKVVKLAQGEMKVMILIGLYTGLRLKDVALLEKKSIDFDKKEISVRPYKTRKTKKKPTIIPLHVVLEAVLLDFGIMGSSGKYVLPETAAEYQRYNPNISFAVRDLFKAAGLKVNEGREDGRGKAIARYSFHSLRHSFVALCHQNNTAQVTVMELVGHSSTAVHQIYVHGDEESKRRAIAALPDVTNG